MNSGLEIKKNDDRKFLLQYQGYRFVLDDAVCGRDNPFVVDENTAAPVANFARLWMRQAYRNLPQNTEV